jgi:hypothetical protein
MSLCAQHREVIDQRRGSRSALGAQGIRDRTAIHITGSTGPRRPGSVDGHTDTPPDCGLGTGPGPVPFTGVFMDLTQALANMIKSEVLPKDFATGSKGFHGSAKITLGGMRYQCQAQAVLVGSKQDPTAVVEATTEEIGIALASLLEDLEPRTFSSGQTGFRADGKVEAHGQRFQASVQAVRLA